MKLLFVHSGAKVKEDKNANLYLEGSYSKEIFKRYLEIGDNLTVILKKEKKIYDEEYAKNKFEIFDNKRIKFIEYKDRNTSLKAYLNLKTIKENNKRIKEQIKANDKIILRLPCTAGYTAAKYARKYHKQYMVEVVGCIWDALWNYNIKGKILAPINYLKMRNATKKADYVIYVTNEFLQKRYPNKNKNIGCSDVSIQEITKETLNKIIKKTKNNDNNKDLILSTVAAIDVKYKGQKDVIKAISKLKKQGYNIKYYLIGGGNKEYLEKIAKKYNVNEEIIFVGPIPHNEVFEYLDFTDIYIQPSKQEGLSRAVVEAMSRACPTIVSNAGGNGELIDKKYVFRKGNVKELIKIIKNISKEEKIKMAKQNYEKSKLYEKERLEKIRKNFYERYINQ